MNQLVERWSTNPKDVGSNPTPVEAFGLWLLASDVILTYLLTFTLLDPPRPNIKTKLITIILCNDLVHRVDFRRHFQYDYTIQNTPYDYRSIMHFGENAYDIRPNNRWESAFIYFLTILASELIVKLRTSSKFVSEHVPGTRGVKYLLKLRMGIAKIYFWYFIFFTKVWTSYVSHIFG